jgi:hypothetical protein
MELDQTIRSIQASKMKIEEMEAAIATEKEQLRVRSGGVEHRRAKNMKTKTKRGIYSDGWHSHLLFTCEPVFPSTFSLMWSRRIGDDLKYSLEESFTNREDSAATLSVVVKYENVRHDIKELARFWVPSELAAKYDHDINKAAEALIEALRAHFELASSAGLPFKRWAKFYWSCPTYLVDYQTFLLHGDWRHYDPFDRIERIRRMMLKKPYTLDDFFVDVDARSAFTEAVNA